MAMALCLANTESGEPIIHNLKVMTMLQIIKKNPQKPYLEHL